MEKETGKIEKSLVVPEKEGVFKRFLNWISSIFGNNKKSAWTEEPIQKQVPEITIPKAVKMPINFNDEEQPVENSLEYLYKLSDDELDNLDSLYDEQMESAKNEIEKLDTILKSYQDGIQKMQEQVNEV